ncbi:MAG: ribosomal RNA small subunit methyltransferase A [Candidatus Wolframiiraptor sp.]|nr:MAG: ribosomal RNA small subunit methyltransferase A [Candidatus Wolframiiraptor sp.]
MKLRRKLGQHFLTDRAILDKMIEYGDLTKSDIVLEVGAGRGELTEKLAERAGKVIAVELDESLAREAESRLKRYSNVRLIVGDILKLKPKGFNKVVSNPPYSISTKLLEWLIESRPELMVLTLQREFASKLVAKPGSPKYLYISFLSNFFYETRIADVLPKKLFKPPPKVDSAIVIMNRRGEEIMLDSATRRFLKYLFTRRGQTLRRVLRDFSKKTRGSLDLIGILPEESLSKRIYQLSPKELIEVAEAVKDAGELAGEA